MLFEPISCGSITGYVYVAYLVASPVIPNTMKSNDCRFGRRRPGPSVLGDGGKTRQPGTGVMGGVVDR